MWELHRWELRSWRSHLQQDPDPISPKNSRSPQTSPPRYQDRSACSCAKTNSTAAVKHIASKEEIDDPKEWLDASMKGSHSTNRNTQSTKEEVTDDLKDG